MSNVDATCLVRSWREGCGGMTRQWHCCPSGRRWKELEDRVWGGGVAWNSESWLQSILGHLCRRCIAWLPPDERSFGGSRIVCAARRRMRIALESGSVFPAKSHSRHLNSMNWSDASEAAFRALSVSDSHSLRERALRGGCHSWPRDKMD